MNRPGPATVARWLPVPGLAVGGVVAGSPLLGVTAPLVVTLGLVERGRRRRWRLAATRADSLPPAIDHLIQQLHSGASLSQACRSLGPPPAGAARRRRVVPYRPGRPSGSADPLEPLVAGLRAGLPLAEAVSALDGDGDPSVRLVATTLGLLAADGGPAVPALRRLRHTLVGRSHRRHRARAVASGATSSAGLLALAPALFALVLAGAEPALARFYLVEAAGTACATASAVLSAGGWWWMQATVARSVGSGT